MLAQVLAIGVFGLFHPARLEVRAAPGERLAIASFTLEGAQAGRLRARGGTVELTIGNRRTRVAAVESTPATFVLAVPGRIERRFRGALRVTASNGILQPVVRMDLETAVASVVAAESPPGARLEALKAQAVVTRSFYEAGRGRHTGFEFCDTTHCQWLREPPAPNAPAFRAASATRGLVLEYRGAPVAALFSANCGGRTRALAINTDGEYPFFPVRCEFCRRGQSSGHGIGLCQWGAAGMARLGSSFQEILHRYFPNTALTSR